MSNIAQPTPACDYISGKFTTPHAPDEELLIRSPADQRHLVARVASGRDQVTHAVTAAHDALASWFKKGIEARARWLKAYQSRLRTHQEGIATAIAWEVGKPLWEARAEVAAMIAKVDLSLGPGMHYTQDEHIDELPGEIRYKPLGVLSVIGPFNFPGHLPNGQIVPALLTGNCVVFKPSEKTPTTATWMARCFAEADLPQGVFNLVQGGASVGEVLAHHPGIDGILFTGSRTAGQRIVEANLQQLNRLVALELGGKNAALALSDCDIEHTARMIAFSAFVTAGQRCTATSRLIVSRDIAQPLCDRLVSLARGLRIGHPVKEDDVFMGPMISQHSAERLYSAQAQARACGFTALLPGGPLSSPPAPGAYILPSLHRYDEGGIPNVPGYSDDELFAPDLAIYLADDDDHACALESSSKFGLSATVFTASRARFEGVASQLRVGVLHWNRPGAGASSRLPFSGVRDSGNHRPVGILAGVTCTFPQAVLLERGGPPPSWPGFLK